MRSGGQNYVSFLAVARCGTISAAATELGLPRPTVSRQITRLEADLGVALVHRTTRRVTTTAAGQRLLERLVPLLDAWDDALPFLEQGARSITRNTSMACDALLLAARVRQGSPMSIAIARDLDLTEVEGVLGEGTPLRDLVRHVLDGELARHDGTIHEVPTGTVALRVWGRSLADRTR